MLRTIVAAVSGVVATGAIVWVVAQLRHGQSPADIASLVGLVIAVVSAGISVEGLRAARAALGQPADGAVQARSAALTLAKHVEKTEAEQWRRLVGGTRARINLRYTLHPRYHAGATTEGSLGLLFAEQTASGLPDIAAFYRATTPARLVITGGPGAGKTVLALELLLALIEQRGESDPVPVRVSLSGWPTDRPLTEHLIDHLVQAYDVPRSRAAQLVDHDLVLPVLDGLDEMDPGLTHADGAPVVHDDGQPLPDPAAPRARAALRALNIYSRGLTAGPVVLTCRTSHYAVLADDDQLADAAEVRIEPVPAGTAVAYLAQRSGQATRWRPLLDHLRTESSGLLAQSLSTPWRLSLAAMVYHRGGDPTSLARFPTAAALDRHLLARLIPAAIALHPPKYGYSPESVHHWLSRIARHLHRPTTGPIASGGARTDIHLHQLWPLAGELLVRVVDAVLAIVFVLACAGLLLAQISVGPSLHEGFGAAGFAVVGTFAVLRALSPQVGPPVGVHLPPLSSPRGRRQLVRAFLVTLGGGLAGGMAIGLATGATYGLAAGLAYALAAALAAGISRQTGSSSDEEPVVAGPSRLVWTDLLVGVATGLIAGVATGLTVGLTYGAAGGIAGGITAGLSGALAAGLSAGLVYGLMAGLATGLATSLVTGLPTGLTLGIAGGLVGGIYLFTGAGRRYMVFLCCAYGRRMLPLRMGSFLDWAYAAGLLRLSGSAYQFRHRELQQWLEEPFQGPI
ncbi:NACHT domain-containing protein [Streptomyces sp. CA-249302]|uniref:NACHT domain-containing protein n=1 Tax=Streptomyces sp. CA-249302 TaxID=3240058 RepID=UPI003D905439